MDISSRNGHRPGSGQARTVVQAKPLTAYEAAIAAASESEKERLRTIRLQFDIPPNSPEWGFYAVLAPLVAASTTEKTLEAIVERLERVEQGVDDLKKQPAISSDLSAQMARLEALLRHGSHAADPLASAIRYFLVFAAGVAVCELIFAAVGFGRLEPPVFDRMGMFVLGLSATAAVLLWLWFWPHVKARRQ
jgi:hypothetical protein